MFDGQWGQIHEVHVYDGSSKVQEFTGLHLSGDHCLALDGANSFNLGTPHKVIWGICITFLLTAGIVVGSPPSRLILAAAGGDLFVA